MIEASPQRAEPLDTGSPVALSTTAGAGPHGRMPATLVVLLSVAGCLFLPDRSVENRGREPLRVESVNVAEGDTDVPLDVSIEIRFNQPLDPASLEDASMQLGSGSLRSLADVRFDALTRTLVFDPRSDLRPGLWYEFTMDAFPLSIMGTAYLDEPLQIRFGTGTETGATPAVPRPAVDFETKVWPVIGAGGCGCHSEASRAMGFVIPADPDAFLSGSVATPSREWPGWRIVDPGQHARSYLIYKLLGDERLGMPTIMGETMPPGAPLPMQDIETIRDWIEQGAGS